LNRAERRLRGAQAAQELVGIGEQIKRLREEAERVAGERGDLQPSLAAAQKTYIELSAAKQNRQEELDRLDRSIGELAGLQHKNELERAELVQQGVRVALDARLRRWGGTVEDASRHVLALDEPDQHRTAEDWAREACDELTGVLDSCFGSAEEEHIPR
jgi:chromosome segregation protein